MPQVQTIRDVLDNDAYCTVVKERELRDALDNMKKPPALVITDSQAFLKVAGDTPDDVPMTSFSILFARFKGDLPAFAAGAQEIDALQPGDKILIAEACTHHRICEDIGQTKIPRWLTQYVGGKLDFEFTQGHDFPADVSGYRLVIHCGSCVFNPRLLMSRIIQCNRQGVAITNYGMAISYALGIFERALAPFGELPL
jgi:[FeFe] hydrogenase H-cluster maturation GTPase HydF